MNHVRVRYSKVCNFFIHVRPCSYDKSDCIFVQIIHSINVRYIKYSRSYLVRIVAGGRHTCIITALLLVKISFVTDVKNQTIANAILVLVSRVSHIFHSFTAFVLYRVANTNHLKLIWSEVETVTDSS